MGRTPLLTKLSNEIRIENSRKNDWLVTYGFPSSRPNPNFFKKLVELTDDLHRKGANVDKSRTSIFMTNDLHGAVTAVKLAKHYGADVRLYKVEEMDPKNSIEPDYEFKLEKDEVSSVMIAVHYMLSKISKKCEHFNDDITQLVIFLYVVEYFLRPNLPLKKQDLEKILEQTIYLEDRESYRIPRVPFILELINLAPIMRAVEVYLEENKRSLNEDINILFNVLNRLHGSEDIPFEPSIGDIEELIILHPVDNLVERIKNAGIIHEIR